MPPHGHGGHHGGGHHGGHGGGGWRGGWGPGWYGPGNWGSPAYAELVVPSCPNTLDPALASDGRVYNNPCLAQTAGVSVVKRMPASKVTGFGAVSFSSIPPVAVIAAVGVGLYFLLKRR